MRKAPAKMATIARTIMIPTDSPDLREAIEADAGAKLKRLREPPFRSRRDL
jgi:hypothetical protein